MNNPMQWMQDMGFDAEEHRAQLREAAKAHAESYGIPINEPEPAASGEKE